MTLSLFTEPATDGAAQAPAHVQTEKTVANAVPRIAAITLAAPIFSAIKPVCSQIAVAGSVRRGRTYVHDIEYTAVEKYAGACLQKLHHYCFEHQLRPETFFKKKGERQIQARLNYEDREFIFELFLAQPDTYGWTQYLRTGPHEWNIATLQQLKSLGLVMENNRIIRGTQIIPCPDESVIFKLMGLPTIEPKFRTTPLGLARALTEAGQQPKFSV